jgi:hypothetical protein
MSGYRGRGGDSSSYISRGGYFGRGGYNSHQNDRYYTQREEPANQDNKKEE